MNIQTQRLNQQPLSAFKSIFTSLSPPEIYTLKGVYRALYFHEMVFGPDC